jgi:hypothetical protein
VNMVTAQCALPRGLCEVSEEIRLVVRLLNIL